LELSAVAMGEMSAMGCGGCGAMTGGHGMERGAGLETHRADPSVPCLMCDVKFALRARTSPPFRAILGRAWFVGSWMVPSSS
jgi:hypothetical protein